MNEPLDPADTVLQEIEAIGKRSLIPSIGPVKGKILAEAVNKTRRRRILEVGALYGYSAILMTKHSPPKTEIISVDNNAEHVGTGLENISDRNLEGNLT